MSRAARVLVTAVTAVGLAASGGGLARAASPPAATLTFYAPTTYHPGTMGVNGDLHAGTAPISGAAVTLQVAAAEAGPFSRVTTTTTGTAGRYAVYTPVSNSAWYRTVFAGDTTAGPAVSRVIHVVIGPLPTRNHFWAPDVHGDSLAGMNGEVQGGWDQAGDTVALEVGTSDQGPWSRVTTTTVRATSISNWGTYVFRVPLSTTSWYRTRYLGSSTSQPSTSAPQQVLVVPGLLLWKQLYTGNNGAGAFSNTRMVRVSVSAACGSRVFGGTRFKVFDTTNRLVVLDTALTPDTHVQATRLFAVTGRHELLAQTYCPGQISVRLVS